MTIEITHQQCPMMKKVLFWGASLFAAMRVVVTGVNTNDAGNCTVVVDGGDPSVPDVSPPSTIGILDGELTTLLS
jgi:hypothetical protein